MNAVRGNTFHEQVYAALRLPENTTKVTGIVRRAPVNVEPDLLGVRTGVTDIKDEISISFDRQLRAEYDVAVQRKETLNLIISPRTQTISVPLQNAVRLRDGVIIEFDPGTSSFRQVRMQGNRVLR
jgi:filamentous hemagglutinin